VIALASQLTQAAPNGKDASDIPGIGQYFDLIVEFFSKFLQGLLFFPEDPAQMQDFTYKIYVASGVAGLTGVANMSNVYWRGLSKHGFRDHFTTVNYVREEIGLHLRYPMLSVDGNYSLDAVEQVCVFGCTYTNHIGLGQFQHNFTNVTMDFLYRLDNITTVDSELPSTRYSPMKFETNFDSCSLFAENYLVDSTLQTNWDERSEWFRDTHGSEAVKRARDVLLGEILAMTLNVPSRVAGLTPKLVLDQLVARGAVIVP
jgi:hypothetical protein